MMMTLGQAARAAGISKATLSKALASGRVSYVSKDTSGYQIDPAELFRVFTPKQKLTVQGERLATPRETPVNTGLSEHDADVLFRQIDDLRADRDAWREQAQRLALAPPKSEERRRWWRL